MFLFAPFLLGILPPCVLFAWIVRAFPAAGRRRVVVASAIVAFAVITTITGELVTWHAARWLYGVHFAVVFVSVMMVMTAPGLLALMGASLAAGVRARRAPGGDSPTGVRRRQVVEAAVGGALFGATGAALGWGIARGRHEFRLVELPVKIPGLPRALDGYVIAQVSDIHSGEFVDGRQLDDGLSLVRLARPDLVVVTGDIVDIDAAFAGAVAQRLAAFAPRDGIFACMGNHDHYAGAGEVAATLRSAGIETLVNAGRVIRPGDGGGFALLGVEDISPLRRGGAGPDLNAALAAVPPSLPRILLSHQPPTVDRWAGEVALQLSGHTHGGQINPGGIVTNVLFEYVAGLYSVRGTSLYVNRGFGTVGPPARIGVPPEVTRIVLVAA
jgi:predicted MPP superfamily phosphohydrolase